MRKLFYGLGVVTALLIVAGAIGLFVLGRKGAALDSASKTYLDQAVPAIAANWDADELWKRASPDLRRIAPRAQMYGLFAAAREALGPMSQYNGSRGEAIMSMYNGHSAVTARYVARGAFQKGNADLNITLIKQGDAWMIEGFHIGSPTLMRTLVGTSS